MFTSLMNDIRSRISISDEALERFTFFWKTTQLAKNDFLLRNGSICRYDSFVVKGSLKAYYINAKTGKEEILFFSIENWWATDIDSFTNRHKSIYNIVAMEDCTLLQIDHTSFNDLLREIPALERYFRLILEQYTASLQKRIIMANSFTAEEHYDYFVQRYPKLVQRVPQYLIASYLGITPEFLSRIKARK